MMAVPGVLPVTTPVLPTVATDTMLLAHVPPGVASASITGLPKQAEGIPVIGLGIGSTVTTVPVAQPVPKVYDTIVVPGAIPATVPVLAPMVPTATVLLLQVPPAVLLPNVVVCPWHTSGIPLMLPGTALMVITMVFIQPVGGVLVIIAVPLPRPVTLPVVGLTDTVASALVQVPPATELARVIVAPTHKLVGPVITGSGYTVTGVVAEQPVGIV